MIIQPTTTDQEAHPPPQTPTREDRIKYQGSNYPYPSLQPDLNQDWNRKLKRARCTPLPPSLATSFNPSSCLNFFSPYPYPPPPSTYFPPPRLPCPNPSPSPTLTATITLSTSAALPIRRRMAIEPTIIRTRSAVLGRTDRSGETGVADQGCLGGGDGVGCGREGGDFCVWKSGESGREAECEREGGEEAEGEGEVLGVVSWGCDWGERRVVYLELHVGGCVWREFVWLVFCLACAL
ncbi:hypothetical protein BKA64DRAFT_152886 [Cadophora sp. MPI-SDFR-AT-0126]|nr:hypothetical protein BKA64DRAFT_152886 [Leotiomycetes sp. MPI-SDFR-AT-0126]